MCAGRVLARTAAASGLSQVSIMNGIWVLSWDNLLTLQDAELIEVHLFAVHHLAEAELAQFGGGGHHVPVIAQRVVAEIPVGQPRNRMALEAVLPVDVGPERLLVGHLGRKIDRLDPAGLHAEMPRESRPQIPIA